MNEVYPQGTKAITKIGEITGLVTAVQLRGLAIRYEFSYFNNGDYKSEWVDEVELNFVDEMKIKIGFKTA